MSVDGDVVSVDRGVGFEQPRPGNTGRRVIVRVSVVESSPTGWVVVEDESRSIEARPDHDALRDAMDAALDCDRRHDPR